MNFTASPCRFTRLFRYLSVCLLVCNVGFVLVDASKDKYNSVADGVRKVPYAHKLSLQTNRGENSSHRTKNRIILNIPKAFIINSA